MSGWGYLAPVALAGAAGFGLKVLGIKPDGSPGWLWAAAILFATLAAFALNKAQDRWPPEGQAPPFEAVENLALAAGAVGAALVMMGLAGVGGIA